MQILVIAFVLLTSPIVQASDYFAFNLEKGTDPGCIKVSYVTTSGDFPNLENGLVTTVRFFFSKKGKFDVTENSPFQETRPTQDANGGSAVSPDLFCGFAPGHYFFKYGLFDGDDKLLDFMTNDQWESYSNSVDVDDVP